MVYPTFHTALEAAEAGAKLEGRVPAQTAVTRSRTL
jgi:hypothetical protein